MTVTPWGPFLPGPKGWLQGRPLGQASELPCLSFPAAPSWFTSEGRSQPVTVGVRLSSPYRLLHETRAAKSGGRILFNFISVPFPGSETQAL